MPFNVNKIICHNYVLYGIHNLCILSIEKTEKLKNSMNILTYFTFIKIQLGINCFKNIYKTKLYNYDSNNRKRKKN